MALRDVNALTMMVAVLLAAAAAAPPAQENEDEDVNGSFFGFVDRVRHLESSWAKLDRQLQKGAEDMDLLHKKLDRLERLMSTRIEGNNEKLETRTLNAQNAAERAASACTRLHHKLHTNSFGAQSTQTGSQGQREPSRASYPQQQQQQRDTSQWYDHHKERKDSGYQADKRPVVMQQDATSTFSKEASTISTKITKMYNELWRRSTMLEGLTKDSMALMNVTRRETQDGFRSVMQQTRRSFSTLTQPTSQPCSLDQVVKTGNAIQHKLIDIDHKLGAKLEEVMTKQDTCRRTQLNQLTQLEEAVVNVLDRLSEAILNKTSVIFNALHSIQDFSKTHNAHVITAISKINEAMLMSAKESKDLSRSVDVIGNTCRQQSANGKNNQLYEKLETVVGFLQEVQEVMTFTDDHEAEETKTTSISEKHNQENSNIDNSKILESISLLCKNKTHETNNVIEKLSHLIEKLQMTIWQLEEKDNFFDNEELDKEVKEAEVKLRHGRLNNITTPSQLIERLSQIKYEPSYEDTSTDTDTEENFARYPHQQPYEIDSEGDNDHFDLTTEGPKTKKIFKQNRKHRTFLTNNQIRGIHASSENNDQSDYEDDNHS